MNETLTFNPETHPQENGRFICSKEHPMPAIHSGKWQHPDAESIDEDYGRGGGVADGTKNTDVHTAIQADKIPYFGMQR